MKRELETAAYLPPQEQLIVARKVNRLCEADSATFDPKTQVQDAQDIVNALNSRIKPHGRFSGHISILLPPTSGVRAGATNAGNVDANFGGPKTKEFEFSVEEYRIGNYVATKHTGKTNNMQIIFEHFRDKEIADKTLEGRPQDTKIVYDKKSLEVQEINIGVPVIRKIACLTIVTYQNTLLWKKSK